MNVLAVGAHFDDVELGCGGSLARHVGNGDKVYIYIATKSGYKDPRGVMIRNDETALQEGLKAAKIIGAQLITDSFDTLFLEFNDVLNAKLVKIIEEYNINLLYTHFDGDVHHDHIALAKSSLHAARHVPCILMYKSNWYQGTSNFKANFFVDITEYFETKRKSIMAHKTETERTNGDWLLYFEQLALINGKTIGVQKAEAFQLVKWGM